MAEGEAYREQFARIMAFLAEIFDDGKPPGKQKIEAYWRVLKKYPMDKIKIASDILIRKRTYRSFPLPADIIKYIPKDKLSPHSAWQEVVSCLENGYCPSDPYISKVIDVLGGWSWLSLRTYDDLHWIEKRFLEHYESALEHYESALEHYESIKVIGNIYKNPELLES
jgi:hypothetical protein